MRELFVYYRVAADQALLARAEVERLQAELRDRHAGLQTRLLHGLGHAEAAQTWMEIYSRPLHRNGVTRALQMEIEAAADRLVPLIMGPRHLEAFRPF